MSLFSLTGKPELKKKKKKVKQFLWGKSVCKDHYSESLALRNISEFNPSPVNAECGQGWTEPALPVPWWLPQGEEVAVPCAAFPELRNHSHRPSTRWVFTCHTSGIFLTANGAVKEINVYPAHRIYHWSKSGAVEGK